MARSPLEMMIDQATGYDPSKVKPRDLVTISCPQCKQAKRVERHFTDPPGTAEVRSHCPKCNPGDHELVDYFDAKGRQIYPE